MGRVDWLVLIILAPGLAMSTALVLSVTCDV